MSSGADRFRGHPGVHRDTTQGVAGTKRQVIADMGEPSLTVAFRPALPLIAVLGLHYCVRHRRVCSNGVSESDVGR